MQTGTPLLTGQFQSSSGRTVLSYYRHAFSGGSPTSFRGTVQLTPGFDQVEVLLCGFSLAADWHEAEVGRVAVNVQKFGYDAQTGALELGITTQFVTDGQTSSSEVTFVVIMTDVRAARFSPISTGCGGVAECNITTSVPVAVPTGMEYIGIGTQIWDVGSDSGPVPMNAVGGDVASLTVGLPSVAFDFLGVLRNGTFTNRMFCEWQGLVVAFDPAELTRAITPLQYQYTFLGHHVGARQFFYNQAQSPTNQPNTGFLDASQGSSLLFSQSINGPEERIWFIESSAEAPLLTPTGSITRYGVFLSSRYGETQVAAPDYTFQVSRLAGFLH